VVVDWVGIVLDCVVVVEVVGAVCDCVGLVSDCVVVVPLVYPVSDCVVVVVVDVVSDGVEVVVEVVEVSASSVVAHAPSIRLADMQAARDSSRSEGVIADLRNRDAKRLNVMSLASCSSQWSWRRGNDPVERTRVGETAA